MTLWEGIESPAFFIRYICAYSIRSCLGLIASSRVPPNVCTFVRSAMVILVIAQSAFANYESSGNCNRIRAGTEPSWTCFVPPSTMEKKKVKLIPDISSSMYCTSALISYRFF